MANKFSKSDKLCGAVRIQHLFAEGKTFLAYPIRVCYLPVESMESTQVLMSVPKRLFKRAVKRNRLKRLMREAYRLNNTDLDTYCRTRSCRLQIAFQYISSDLADYQMVEKAMRKALRKISEQMEEHHEIDKK